MFIYLSSRLGFESFCYGWVLHQRKFESQSRALFVESFPNSLLNIARHATEFSSKWRKRRTIVNEAKPEAR